MNDDDGSIDDFPDIFAAFLKHAGITTTDQPAAGGQLIDAAALFGHRYVRQAFDNEISNLLAAREGTRNDALNKASMKIGQLVAAGVIDQQEAIGALRAAAENIGLDPQEIVATIRSGYEFGLTQPRDLEHLQKPEIAPKALTRATETSNPNTEATARETAENAAERDTSLAADLSWITRGETRPQTTPELGLRDDEQPIFYRNSINGIFGEAEAAKTWFALTITTQTINQNGTVAFIDVDDNQADNIATRLQRLGAAPETIGNHDHFRCYEPQDAQQFADVVDEIVKWQPDLVFLDSIGNFMPLIGRDSNNNDDYRIALQWLKLMMNSKTGVVTIDHTPKQQQNGETIYAIGASQKRAAISGLYLHAKAVLIPAPGTTGRINLTISKDRHGAVRAKSPGGAFGTFILDSETDPDKTFGTILPNTSTTSEGRWRPTIVMQRISDILQDSDDALTLEQITPIYQKQFGGKKQDNVRHIKNALRCLVDEGYAQQINETLNGPKTAYKHLQLFAWE